MRRIFTFFLTFLLGVFVTALYAQTHTVSGTVIDKDANEPLIGANVLIKGTTIGTVTDLDGKYTLQAGDKDILVFSYLSMKTIEEPVKYENHRGTCKRTYSNQRKNGIGYRNTG